MKKVKDKIQPKNFYDKELLEILSGNFDFEKLRCEADFVRRRIYGNEVFVRGLIEFSNYCKNDCFYCGLRHSNKNVVRYRLEKNEILECCKKGYTLGFRTFVLQSGEDLFFDDEKICQIVSEIKREFPDCAVTLSIGEKSRKSYQKFFDAGAERYLLRHESANETHYKKLHPNKMNFKNRIDCLFTLKEIGYQVGAGFIVGSPFQINENLIEDLRFLQKLAPDMIGIGPFIPHHATPFAKFECGSVKKTLALISILRLMFPYALIPATTALDTLDPTGHEDGLKSGANVLMPNLSPAHTKKLYEIYDKKKHTGKEDAQFIKELSKQIESIGYKIIIDRGDVKK